jgi:hypothetical protein
MPTLTIEVDLPEETYQEAIALPIEEQHRVVTNAFAVATNGAPDTTTGERAEVGTSAAERHRAMFARWTEQPATDADADLETLRAALAANRIASGEVPLF